MEKGTTLAVQMPKTLEFLCIRKEDKSIIEDCSLITLTDINKESSPYLLVSKVSKDINGVSLFPGSIVKIINHPDCNFVVDTLPTGEIYLLKFKKRVSVHVFDEEEFELMYAGTFVYFSRAKLESIGHIYDERRIGADLEIDYFKSLIDLK
jgi:hypothetical protein